MRCLGRELSTGEAWWVEKSSWRFAYSMLQDGNATFKMRLFANVGPKYVSITMMMMLRVPRVFQESALSVIDKLFALAQIKLHGVTALSLYRPFPSVFLCVVFASRSVVHLDITIVATYRNSIRIFMHLAH